MPRSLRYLMVWLSCTAVTVSAVFLTVRFVVHSTAPMPPTAHADQIAFNTGQPLPGATSPTPTATRSPSPTGSATATTRAPKPSPTRTPATSRPSTSPPAPPTTPADTCEGGVGVHSVQSQGGLATLKWGADAVCLVSAVPSRGFTTKTAQGPDGALVITFSGAKHRSKIDATLTPQAKAVTTETSW